MSRIDDALKRAGLGDYPAMPAVPQDSLEGFSPGLVRSIGPISAVPRPVSSAPRILRAPELDTRARPGLTVGGPGPVFSGFNPALVEKLVVSEHMRSAAVEQYRRLAAALHHAQADRGIKTVMVASTLAREGKTLTAANLALTLAESYRRSVLVIDADLRRPSMHDVFQVPNVSGLGDRLKAETDRALRVIEISPRLSLLPAGQPDADPMGGLTSDAMAHLLHDAGTCYDWVVIDTPPVGLMHDANLLAAMVDVAIFVIGAGQTPCHLLQKAVEAIGPDRIMGVVLNKVADEAVPAGSYYGSYLTVSAGGAGR